MTTSTKRTSKRDKPAPPPYNVEAERAVLGGLLIDPEQVDQWADMLRPDDFQEPRHEATYRAIQSLHAESLPADVVHVDQRLGQTRDLDDVGQFYVHELANTCTSSGLVPHYARIVLSNSVGRQGQRAAAAYIEGTTTRDELMARLQALGARLDKAQRGKVLTMGELMTEDIPPVRWIVPKLIPEGLTILGAKMKVGKSWMAYGLGIAVGTGGVFLGERVEAGEALYLALEDSNRRLQSRGRKLLCGASAPDRLYLETTWPRLDDGGLGRLEHWLKEHEGRARVVIIDVFQRIRPPHARGGDAYAEDYAVLGALKTLADTYHIAIVVLHHTRKQSADDVYDELHGSTGIGGAADTVLILSRKRGEREAELHITGREIEQETTYVLRHDADTCAWQMVGTAEEVALSKQRTDIAKTVQAMEKRNAAYEADLQARVKRGELSERDLPIQRKNLTPITPKTIAEEMGESKRYNTIKNLVVKMANDGQLVANGDGTYKSRSLRSLDGQNAPQPAPEQGLGETIGETTPEDSRSLRSLDEQNGHRDYADYAHTMSVVSRGPMPSQATSGLEPLEATETTQTTQSDRTLSPDYLTVPCPHCQHQPSHVVRLPNGEIRCEDCGERLMRGA